MNWKSIISLFIGAAVGSTATYLITKEKFEKRAMADVEEMEKYFKKTYGVDEPAEKEANVDDDEPALQDIIQPISTSATPKSKPAVKGNTTQYDKFSKVKDRILNTNNKLLYEDSDDNLEVRRKVGKKGMYEPTIIDQEEFLALQNTDGWEAMEVYYDGVGTDGYYFHEASGETVSNDSIGNEALQFFTSQADEGEVVFVRNDELCMVFEIIYEAPHGYED